MACPVRSSGGLSGPLLMIGILLKASTVVVLLLLPFGLLPSVGRFRSLLNFLRGRTLV